MHMKKPVHTKCICIFSTCTNNAYSWVKYQIPSLEKGPLPLEYSTVTLNLYFMCQILKSLIYVKFIAAMDVTRNAETHAFAPSTYVCPYCSGTWCSTEVPLGRNDQWQLVGVLKVLGGIWSWSVWHPVMVHRMCWEGLHSTGHLPWTVWKEVKELSEGGREETVLLTKVSRATKGFEQYRPPVCEKAMWVLTIVSSCVESKLHASLHNLKTLFTMYKDSSTYQSCWSDIGTTT